MKRLWIFASHFAKDCFAAFAARRRLRCTPMSLAVCAALCLPLAIGCVVTTSEPDGAMVPASTGTFSVRWSVAGSFDPNACDAYRASALDLRIYDSSGAFVTQRVVACRTMGTSVALYPGGYTGTMTMTDGAGTARTTTLNLRPFSIQSGATTTGDTDFPADSFY
jgi:hypothetical protein